MTSLPHIIVHKCKRFHRRLHATTMPKGSGKTRADQVIQFMVVMMMIL